MTHPTIASTGGFDAYSADMLRVASELEASGIEVGWDPFPPGQGYASVFDKFASVRPLTPLVKQSDLARAHRILEDLESGD
jgi:hypothetical protein